MFNSQTIKNNLESEFLTQLIYVLKQSEIDTPDAKLITKEFLDLFPMQSLTEVTEKISQFTKKYPLFKNLNIIIMQIAEEEKTSALLNKMRGLLKNNQVDEAINLAK